MSNCIKCDLPLTDPPSFDAAGQPACWAHRARTELECVEAALALMRDASGYAPQLDLVGARERVAIKRAIRQRLQTIYASEVTP